MPDTDKLIAAIDSYSASAIGGSGLTTQGGELSRQRSLALDAFAGKNIEPAPEGRSQVTDRTLFETVMWIMPSLMRIYGGLNGDSVVEFDPTGPDDEDAAEQESEYLNYLVTQKNDWDLIARTWMQDALLTKNAYCMAYLERRMNPEVERYEGQTEEQVALLLEDDVEVVGQNVYQDPDDEGTLINPETGQPVQNDEEAAVVLQMYMQMGVEPQLQYRMLFDLELKRVKPTDKLQFKVLPPERVKVASDAPSFQIDDDTDYFEYWESTTISELRKLGYDVSDDLATGDSLNYESDESWARDEVLEMDYDRDQSVEPSMRKVVVRTIWIRHDYDEDGIAELQRVVRVGTEILDREEANRIPVACIVPFMNTHRHMGMSIADVVFDVQRIKQAILRGGLDGLNLSLNPRHAVNKDIVNIDDLLVSRPGGVVRVEGMPQEGIMPLQTENTLPNALLGLQHMDRVLESRAGVSSNFTGIDASAMSGGNDYNMIGQLSSMAAQRVEDIARMFASGYKRLFSIAHELIIKSGRVEKTIRLRGQWVDVDPSQWRTGRDMRVVAPFAAGNKDVLLQRLMMVAQLQERAAAAGVPIVDADDAYNLALEISKAADIPGTKFFTDPATIPQEEPGPDPTMIALEIENKKADNAAEKAQIDAEVDKYQADLSAEVDRYRADLNAELQVLLARIKAGEQVSAAEMKSKLSITPIEVGGRKATVEEAQALLETQENTIDVLDQEVRRMEAEHDEILRLMNEPKEIIRENGKVVGIRQGDAVRQVIRENGRIVGVEAPSVEVKPRQKPTQEMAVEKINQRVENSLADISKSIENLIQATDAPKEVVRDENGEVVGIRQNGKVRDVVRDNRGRVSGLA